MKKRILSSICSFAVLLPALLSGCQSASSGVPTEPTTPIVQNAFHIVLKDHIPSASVGVNYDLNTVVKEEDGITYDYAATYIDPETGKTKDLKVTKGRLKAKAEADITVTVTATRGNETSTTTFVIPVSISADIMDKLLTDPNTAGQAGEGVVKTIHKEHLQGDTSTSSIAATFSNSQGGTHLLTLSHYSLQPYFSAQVWDNAAVTFWVYNPMDQDVNFKLSCHDYDTSITLLWDSESNTQTQTAKAGQWTKINFSLYDMGILNPLYAPATYQNGSYLNVLAQYAGEGPCTIYIDGVDIVDAQTVEGLTTGYHKPSAPSGNYSDLLSSCSVYTQDSIANLTSSPKSNGGRNAYSFSADQPCGYPTFYLDFPTVTNISGFDYLKFDILTENAYPHVTAAIRYLDKNGEIKKHGISYDYYANNEWQTIYLNLDYANFADLTQVVGICFSVHMDSQFRTGKINTVYFDNVSLYEHPEKEPLLPPATLEDHDIISGPLYAMNIKPNISGVCKVAADETGTIRSNSTLLFWANNACGYPAPEAHFRFDHTQDWSAYRILSFDTHQSHGHYWMQFQVFYLDENGKEQSAVWYYDTIATNWQTNHASLDWFKTSDGENITTDMLTRVVGFKIAANLAINVTDEVPLIYFDNFEFS